MQPEPTNHKTDIQRLIDDGYTASVENGCIVVRDVPYLDSALNVIEDGILVDSYPATDHTFHFSATPHKTDGKALLIANDVSGWNGHPMRVRLSFKRKDTDGVTEKAYIDQYDKVTHYFKTITAHALSKNPDLVLQKYRPLDTSTLEESPFNYEDSNSSRAGINHVNNKLKGKKIAVIGIGGTGSYILDLVSKTPVAEIHIFDGDIYHTHNAFRSPAAPSITELSVMNKKVTYFSSIYSKMHKRIIPHEYDVTRETLQNDFQEIDFVFVCIDGGDLKQEIIETLVEMKIPFIDSGIGVIEVDGSITGTTRLTTITPINNTHHQTRIPYSADAEGVYQSNIQISELNALAASLAVIKWKRLCGFYHDMENEHHTTFIISTNTLTNDEKHES